MFHYIFLHFFTPFYTFLHFFYTFNFCYGGAAENTTFAIGRRERKWYFSPARQIVHYATSTQNVSFLYFVALHYNFAASIRDAKIHFAVWGQKYDITHLGRKKLGQAISRLHYHMSWRPKWQTRDMGWLILLLWSQYYFLLHPGRKCHIRVLEPGSKVALSARFGDKFILYYQNEQK